MSKKSISVGGGITVHDLEDELLPKIHPRLRQALERREVIATVHPTDFVVRYEGVTIDSNLDKDGALTKLAEAVNAHDPDHIYGHLKFGLCVEVPLYGGKTFFGSYIAFTHEGIKHLDASGKNRKVPHIKRGPCECGSEAVGSPKHSTWCPAH